MPCISLTLACALHQSDLGVCYAWQVGELKQRNRKLKLNLQERRAQRKELQGRVQHADSQWSQAAADYEHLQASVHSMRCSLEVHPCALDRLEYFQCLYHCRDVQDRQCTTVEMCKTDSFGETRLVLHVPSSS